MTTHEPPDREADAPPALYFDERHTRDEYLVVDDTLVIGAWLEIDAQHVFLLEDMQ